MSSRRAYQTLQRLRQADVDQAARELAESLAGLQAQQDKLIRHRRDVAEEQRQASQEDAAHLAVWLSHARQREAAIQREARTQDVLVMGMRQKLAACRVEAEAVSKVLTRLDEAAACERARLEQSVMDEIAMTFRPVSGSAKRTDLKTDRGTKNPH
jgi:flagellar biosynthesis chaperone FliJ